MRLKASLAGGTKERRTLMDIEKLIEQLNGYFEGKDLKRGVALDAATALSALQAENEKLRADIIRFNDLLASYQNVLVPELRAELEQVKRALAMMWFAYVNSDKETPHSYETEALVEAEHILGPWSECMPIYLSRGQKEE